jgi:hypothetical protein
MRKSQKIKCTHILPVVAFGTEELYQARFFRMDGQTEPAKPTR